MLPMNEAASDPCDDIRHRFEDAWSMGERPNLDEFLPEAKTARWQALVALVRVELEQRLAAGEAARVEHYLERYPELAAQAGIVIDLLKAEYSQRQRQEPALALAEYCRRFPQYQEQLQAWQAEWQTDGPLSNRPAHDTGPRAARGAAMPSRLGRYRITATLGSGGFGVVYKGHDDELRRDVAIKVPHPERIAKAEDAAAYLAEARALASLDHPHIVPVYDVGRSDTGLCYVVSKFIAGSDLATKLRTARLSWAEATDLTATVAEALHHAHKQGLVHRDVKPANILIDTAGKPYVADFGLALAEEDHGIGSGYCGTPAYMSPEQANGEGHRVDGRSDIFSLGVVFYELLTGRRPFRGEMPELLDQIRTEEPRPPRQIDDAIPKELERIALKALSKRASARYTTARDMAEDLRHFLDHASDEEKSVLRSTMPPSANMPPSPTPTPPQPPSSDQRPLKIVPKGLRSFDVHDADFFLELLPGPRARDGLPDSIRFWKTRIEETDPDNTFAVGLIYGPSGCGKSSLVKAGLLPRLAENVLPVFVEATAAETETRLLNGLRKRCPGLPEDRGLHETLAALRRGHGIPPGKKVLIVLDQFEQWLHAKKGATNTELVQALRQCDGGRVQCLVMVRDDFWIAATRFLDELEINLLQGENTALVDLFDLDHARKVLMAFGRAFAKLPEKASDTRKEQHEFVNQAIQGLAQEGKVISVRLALFAEMMKGKPWTTGSLKAVGGTAGVGVTFLEETFSSPQANPKHRLHQKAARAVLKALLPESGSDIKGHMRSHAELLAASGYAARPKDFADLLRILDTEIRLITPTDPEGVEGVGVPALAGLPADRLKPVLQQEARVGVPALAGPPEDRLKPVLQQEAAKYYQLTHDYLVHSLRDWLTRKQKETRRGRAELLLADRAAVWNPRPENRQLPSLLQWLNLQVLTRSQNWTPPQRKMMRRATRYHLLRGLMFTALLAGVVLLGWEALGRLEAHNLRGRLLGVKTAEVPDIIKAMAPYRRWVAPLLRAAYTQAQEQGEPGRQLHASLALLPTDPNQVPYLNERLLQGDPDEVVVIREALAEHQQDLVENWWALLEDPAKDQEQRFRAACALASHDPGNRRRWDKVSPDVAARLIQQNPLVLKTWIEGFRRVGPFLLTPLTRMIEEDKGSGPELALLARVYGSYAVDTSEVFTQLEKRLDQPTDPRATAEAKLALAKQQVNVAVALLVMGRGEKVWPLLKHSVDPTRRSFLIERLGPGGVDANVLLARLAEEMDVSSRRAILLSLGEFGAERLSQAERRTLIPRLLQLHHDDIDPGIHSAAELFLRKWQADDKLKDAGKSMATGKVEGKRQWYISKEEHTMMIVPQPKDWFWMGEGQEPHKRRIDRSFAIAAREVTVEQFRRFRKEYQPFKDYAPTDDCPANNVSWYDAAAYCNWLSKEEGLDKEQWCYVPKQGDKYEEGMKMAPDYLQRTGYRLATEAEWEVCLPRGGRHRFWLWSDR